MVTRVILFFKLAMHMRARLSRRAFVVCFVKL